MKFPDRERTEDWRERPLPAGEPVTTPVLGAQAPAAPVAPLPRRRGSAGSWGLALGLGAALAVLTVSSLQDPRSLGTQLDDTVRRVRGVGSDVTQSVADSKDAAAQTSRQALDGVSVALDDSAISLKVKTALAADPALSAARIEVTTTQGIVRLEGPAPDAAAQARATVLASAPRGVRGVDNRLTLPQPGRVVAVAAEPAASPARP